MNSVLVFLHGSGNSKGPVIKNSMRKNRKLTLRTISQEINVSTNLLTAYAHQDVVHFDAAVLEAFCKYFNCEVGDILFYEA